MYKRILIATDGSRLSRTAIDQGVKLAKLCGASVIGCHVTPPLLSSYAEPLLRVAWQAGDEIEHDQAHWARRCLDEIARAAARAGVAFRGVQLTGLSASEALMKTGQKERCDLIVMASHGRRGLARLLLGSETAHVLTHSHIPVLVTR